MVQKSGKLTSYKLVVHPIIYDRFIYTSKGWLALGFLNHPTVTSREAFARHGQVPLRDLKLQSFTGWKGNPQRFLLGTKPAKLSKVGFLW